MPCIVDLRTRLESLLWHSRATIAIAAFLLSMYGFQLLAAGSLRSDAAHVVVEQQIGGHGLRYLLGSPLVHSSHAHLFGNLALLLPGGALAERLIERRVYVVLVYVAGVLSNVLPPLLGVGGFGVGISGAYYGLWTVVGVVYGRRAIRSTRLRWRFFNTFVAVFGLSYALNGVQQWLGVEPVPAGTATGAHLLGIGFGLFSMVGWIAFRRYSADKGR